MNATDLVVIQDLIVTNLKTPAAAILIEADDHEQATSRALIDQMHEHVKGLITETVQSHLTNFCDSDGNLKEDCLNNITRLTTNEFYFYTKRPLSRTEFETLLQKIVNDAKTQPKNIHLVLASFSVRAKDDSVMNVTVHVECGPTPEVHLVVKNYASIEDVKYYDTNGKYLKLINIKDEKGGIKRNLSLLFLQAVEITSDELLSQQGVVVDGKSLLFSFNNVMSSYTAGGNCFYTCIDVCSDNFWGVAKLNINELLSARTNNDRQVITAPGPQSVSHVITSCSTSPVNKIGLVTQADPHFSNLEAKEGAKVQATKIRTDALFGVSAQQIITEPTACDNLMGFAVSENNLPLVSCFIEEGLDINLPVKYGPNLIKPIHLAINSEGCNIHIRTALPKDLQPYTGSYVLVEVNYIPQNLYYINKDGVPEVVKIDDWDLFNSTRRYFMDSYRISWRLNDEQAHTLITTNGGHVPTSNLDMVRYMLDNGVNINETNDEGDLLLHVAIKKGDDKLAMMLIQKGANLHQKNNNLDTPLDVAVSLGQSKIAHQIRKTIFNEIKSEGIPLSTQRGPQA